MRHDFYRPGTARLCWHCGVSGVWMGAQAWSSSGSMEVGILWRTDARHLALRAIGGLVSGGPAVVPVVAFWGCWVGADLVSAMGFAGGEVLLEERGE